MKRFPTEFADLLGANGRRILERGYPQSDRIFHGDQTPLALLPGVLEAETSAACLRLLDRTMRDHVRRVESPIPPEALTGMRENYTELLPKTMRFKTAYFASQTSESYRTAERIGLIDMLRSESLALFAEAVTGLPLYRDRGVQAILYEPGDYAGPHNDHHPENEAARDGFVDLHISFTTQGVESQYLVCEDRGHFSTMYSISQTGSVAVYRLPFWHYTTPLAARHGAKSARRWLLLASFNIVR